MHRSALVNAVLPLAVFPWVHGACTTNTLDWQGSPPSAEDSAEARELADYKAAFATALGEEFVEAGSRARLLDRAASARILFLGDNHRDPVLHRHHLELLAELHERDVPATLVVEALGTADQALVDEYLAGLRSLSSLRRAIHRRWPGSWLDDATLDMAHYNQLLRIARVARWPAWALEPTPRLPLPERDATMVERIRAVAAAHPDRLVVVVVGQAHLLGRGDLIHRVGLPCIALGASVPPALRASALRLDPDPAEFIRCAGGLWFAADHLPVQPDA